MLDERLSLVFDLYDPCTLAADIGADHGLLAAALLRAGRCSRMILTDISASALSHAREEMLRCRLMDRVSLRLGDGLAPLNEACSVISVTGMGGRTIRDILLAGRDRLQGASLIISAHTDIPLVRRAVVLRARPGQETLSEAQLRTGVRLAESASPLLRPWFTRRLEILRAREKGLLSAAVPDAPLLAETREDIAVYQNLLEKMS